MFYIFKRNRKYLSFRYEWRNIPDMFETWRGMALGVLFTKWRDKPTAYAIVNGDCDLDAVEWKPIFRFLTDGA